MNIVLDELSVRKINLIDAFRERFSIIDNEKLKLPQIIVVGDQSSGKSSILEAISGIKLPRGVDTVTKCPVIIQMRHSKKERKQIKCKNEKFRDIENTEEEIKRVQRETLRDQLTEEPITLHIESPKVQTLTIIDLPGIVKIKTADQMTDIVEKTHNIAKMYMKQENSLIICVLPANQDISTTTTINLAEECNKSKSRIIGVLTKLDKIDEKEASLLPDILRNIKVPIKKGYYGLVVGDDFLGLDSKKREESERDTFRKIKIWKDEHKDRLGLNRFIEALVRELMLLINESLPPLNLNIETLITETENDLAQFSKYHDSEVLQSQYIMQISNNIKTKVENVLIDADMEILNFNKVQEFLTTQNYLNPIDKHSTFLFLWHHIFNGLNDSFNIKFKEIFELRNAPYKDLKDLDSLIRQCRVDNVLVFNNSKPFKIIVAEFLALFKEESLKCVAKCYEIMNNLISNVLIIDIEEQFLAIKADVLEICSHILETQNEEVIGKLDYLFESENSYFSQDAIVMTYLDDVKSPSEFPQILAAPKLSNSQSVSNIPMQKMIMGSVAPVASPTDALQRATGDFKKDDDTNQYKHARLLKHCLEKYVRNLILRLGDCIPNFIRLSLFVNFKKAVESNLFIELSTAERRHRYFSLSNQDRERSHTLGERLRLLRLSKIELHDLISPDRRVNGFRSDH